MKQLSSLLSASVYKFSQGLSWERQMVRRHFAPPVHKTVAENRDSKWSLPIVKQKSGVFLIRVAIHEYYEEWWVLCLCIVCQSTWLNFEVSNAFKFSNNL